MNKKIDALGRIVIPIGLRKKYDLHEGATVIFKEEGDFICLTPIRNTCKLCNKTISPDKAFSLCDECINIIKTKT